MQIKKVILTLFLLFSLIGLFASSLEQFQYKNPELPIEIRVSDLLNRMTLEEKLAQIKHVHSWHILNGQELDSEKLEKFCKGISWGFVEGFPLTAENCKRNFFEIQKYMVEKTRLGIPVFTVAESLHGVVQEGCTIYPQNIAMGSTFNPTLSYLKTSAISKELHELGINQVLAPCIDVVRELRWGRVEESFGEDPFLCGKMGIQEVNGYMDNGISPMLKHYGPHGNPLGGLNLASVDCGTRDLHEVYLRPFEMVIKSTPILAVMSSYNSWNRVPNSASHYLMTEVLRNEWGFKGYIYSDWGVIDMLKSFHKTASSSLDAAKQTITNGLDVEASSNCYPSLIDAVNEKNFDVKYIDLAVSRVLYAKFKMGLFEDPYVHKFSGTNTLRNQLSIQLSKQIADESTVLLKNENQLLPLDINRLKNIAIIGPNANQVQFGDYTWSKSNKDGITPLDGIKNLAGTKLKVNFAKGCDIATLDESGIKEAVSMAKKSDVAVVFCGSSSTAFVRSSKIASTSGEGIDLNDISLTGMQQKLIESVYKTGTPTIVVLVTGKPFAIPWIKEHIPAVLVQWYAGEQAGNSIADILFGNVNPSGKTPFSFPQSTGHLPVYYNHFTTDKGYYKSPGSYEHPGRDYVFSSPDALWAFGTGLSYTKFDYVRVKTDKKVYTENDTITVSVDVKNTGKVFGKEVVQVYIRDIVSTIMTPIKQLKGFEKINLLSGEEKSINIKIPVSELYLIDEITGHRFVEEGLFEIQVGSASDNILQTCIVGVGNKTLNQSANEASFESWINTTGRKITVQGVVRDVQATPIQGVEISIKSNKVARTKTDENGKYSIEADEFDQLVFVKKGFQQLINPVEKQKVINVKMDYGH